MKDFGNAIYAFGCVVAATVLGIGVADYWFGHHELITFLSWAGIGGHSVASRLRIFVHSGSRSSPYCTRDEARRIAANNRQAAGAVRSQRLDEPRPSPVAGQRVGRKTSLALALTMTRGTLDHG